MLAWQWKTCFNYDFPLYVNI